MNIHTVFAHRPTMRTVVQVKKPLDITAPTSQLVKLRYVGVGLAPPALIVAADIPADPLAYYILAKN
jgi:hypothetical protein